MGGSFFELLFDPDAPRIKRQRFGKRLARFGVVIVLAQGHTEPEPGLGVIGVERDGFAEIGDGEAGAAAQLRGKVEIADAVGGPDSGGIGRFLDGFGDRVFGLGAVAEAGEEVGDGLAVEGAEDAVGFGGGLEGNGLFGGRMPLFGRPGGRPCGRAAR